MWVEAATWLIPEGTLPPFERGQRLRQVGLRATCSRVRPATGPDAVTYDDAGSGDRSLGTCHVTGAVEWSRSASSQMVLRVHNFRVFCEPSAVLGPTMEVIEAPLDLPPPGSRVTVECTLSVCPEYVLEYLDDGAPDVRSDWLVESIQIELRERVPHEEEPPAEGASNGDVVQVLELEHTRGNDEPEGFNGMYRLDLRLAVGHVDVSAPDTAASRPYGESTAPDALSLTRRRGLLLIPAVLATWVGGALLGLSILMLVAGQLIARTTFADLPAGITYLPPSGPERAMHLVQALTPLVAGVGLLILTWRYRNRGRVWATWLCAVATVVVAVVAFL